MCTVNPDLMFAQRICTSSFRKKALSFLLSSGIFSADEWQNDCRFRRGNPMKSHHGNVVSLFIPISQFLYHQPNSLVVFSRIDSRNVINFLRLYLIYVSLYARISFTYLLHTLWVQRHQYHTQNFLVQNHLVS